MVVRLVDDAHRRAAAPIEHGRPRPLVRTGRLGHCTRRATSRTIPTSPGICWRNSDSTRPSSTRRSPTRPRSDEVKAEHDRGRRRRRLRRADAVLPRGRSTTRASPSASSARSCSTHRPAQPRSVCGRPRSAWLEFPYLFELQRPKNADARRGDRRPPPAVPRRPRLGVDQPRQGHRLRLTYNRGQTLL